MDIELVEKQTSRGEISKRAISEYVEQDENDQKKIFSVCLLIKVILICKCCLISKKQCEKCLVEDTSNTSIIFGNSSYCAIYLLITGIPIISLMFRNTIIISKLFNHLLGRFLYFLIFFILSEKDWNYLMYPCVIYLIVWLIGNKVDEKLISELLY
ncbi:unnamed protein product [Paramecium octaurelia]|uniref:Uncharacterized protein n=1 Tax=Paramecium octaurelia TaxID=43137 RepID=A0A8S1UR43_PAROT|nr:unnamed protein product [Paramecium octaurelia]